MVKDRSLFKNYGLRFTIYLLFLAAFLAGLAAFLAGLEADLAAGLEAVLPLERTKVGCFERPLTMSLSSFPARNAGTLAAAIFNGAKVLGLRPVRAFLMRRSKVPKPTKVTLSPFARAPVTEYSIAESVRVISDLGCPVALATCSTSSARFIR